MSSNIIRQMLSRAPTKVSDIITPQRMQALASTLDQHVGEAPLPGVPLREGDPLPHGWSHVLFLPVTTLTRDLDVRDGSTGGIEPGPTLNGEKIEFERMWAGGQWDFHKGACKALAVGQKVKCESHIEDVKERVGKQGRSTYFVTYRRDIFPESGDAAKPSVSERKTILFRSPMSEAEKAKQPKLDITATQKLVPANIKDNADFSVDFKPSVLTLVRFSALTFNMHKIHWDRHYATQIESHPDLLVHGPLTSLILVQNVEDQAKKRDLTIETFSYRATAPLPVDTHVLLRGHFDGNKAIAWAQDKAGNIYMTADVTLRSVSKL